MRRMLITALLTLGGLAFAFTATAAPLKWHGTATSQTGTLPKLIWEQSGIGTVNNSTGYGHLNNLYITGGLTGSTAVPVTDPLHPH